MPAFRRLLPSPLAPCIAIPCFSGCMQWSGCVVSTSNIDFPKQPLYLILRPFVFRLMPNIFISFGIKEDQILDISVSLSTEVFRIALDPRYVVSEILNPKDLIHNNFDIMADFVIDVKIN